MKRGIVAICLLAAGCGDSSDPIAALPPRPDAALVEELAAQTSGSLGPSFQAVFACGESQGQSFQPSSSATAWELTQGPPAVVLAIDGQGALDVLKQGERSLVPVTAAGGLVIPVKFDPVSGEVAVAVAYTKTGVSESYTFSTFDKGPSFLTWTINTPRAGQQIGARGVQAFIAQCVELVITPAAANAP